MKDDKVVVVDSNIMIKWFIPEEYSHEAGMLLKDFLYGRINIVAPVYAMIEYCNALRKYATRKIISREQVMKIYRLFTKIGVNFVTIEQSLLEEALRYGLDNDITVYDAYYIVLTKHYDTIMYTADEKLLRKIEGVEASVRHIKYYGLG